MVSIESFCIADYMMDKVHDKGYIVCSSCTVRLPWRCLNLTIAFLRATALRISQTKGCPTSYVWMPTQCQRGMKDYQDINCDLPQGDLQIFSSDAIGVIGWRLESDGKVAECNFKQVFHMV